jgi:hypothetical protein
MNGIKGLTLLSAIDDVRTESEPKIGRWRSRVSQIFSFRTLLSENSLMLVDSTSHIKKEHDTTFCS